MFSDENPLMQPVEGAGRDACATTREPVAPDNPLLAMEQVGLDLDHDLAARPTAPPATP